MIKLHPLLLAHFPPSRDLLLSRASQRTDDAMLMDIAEADYGMGAKSAMQLLRVIRDNGSVTAPASGQLFEVLELTRYSDPEHPNPYPFKPGPSGYSGHQTRLFACALLLRLMSEPEYWILNHDEGSTLSGCLISAKVLGDEMGEALARYLTWQLSSLDQHDQIGGFQVYDPVFSAMALLILAVRLRSCRVTEQVIGEAAELVLAQESQEAGWFPTPPMPFSVGNGSWRALAAELKEETPNIRDSNIRELLELCQLILSED